MCVCERETCARGWNGNMRGREKGLCIIVIVMPIMFYIRSSRLFAAGAKNTNLSKECSRVAALVMTSWLYAFVLVDLQEKAKSPSFRSSPLPPAAVNHFQSKYATSSISSQSSQRVSQRVNGTKRSSIETTANPFSFFTSLLELLSLSCDYKRGAPHLERSLLKQLNKTNNKYGRVFQAP